VIAKPEFALQRNGIGGIRKCRRALVCRHHQVGIIVVAAHHALGWNQLIHVQVVGHIQQCIDETPVTIGHLRHHRFAIT
jgi:hypothetical protein